MKNVQIKSLFFLIPAALFVLTAAVFVADAQTRRDNRPPTPTPTPAGIPTIVSLADDRQNESVNSPLQVLPPETTEQKLERYSQLIDELNARIKTLEAGQKKDTDEKQKRLMLNLDILSRAEQRAESLRKQLFELIEKENTVKTRIGQISFDARPEIVERSTALIGSLRPEDVREARRKSLDAERQNLETLLTQIQINRSSLENSLQKADALVEKIRLKFEKEIDDVLEEETENEN